MKKITSKGKKSNLIIVFIGAICSLLISVFLIKNALSDEFVQIPGLTVGLIFGAFAVFFLKSVLSFKIFEIENKKLSISGVGGIYKRTIYLSDIGSYIEIEKDYKHSKHLDLTIFTKDSKYTISSSVCSNYDLVKKNLIKGKKKNLYAEKIWHYKSNIREGIGFSIVGLFFMILFGKIFSYEKLVVLPHQLSTIEGTVLNEIRVEHSGNRAKTKFIKIELEEYPKFNFEIGRNELKATKVTDMMLNVEVGETLKLDILTDQLKKKLTKEIPMNFSDRGFNYRKIRVYGVENQEQSYFDLDYFNITKEDTEISFSLYLLWGFSVLLFFYYGLLTLIKNKKPVPDIRG